MRNTVSSGGSPDRISVNLSRFMFIGGCVMCYFAVLGVLMGACMVAGEMPSQGYWVERVICVPVGLALIFQLLFGFWIWLRFFFPAFGANFSEEKREGRWYRSFVYHRWSCVFYGVLAMILPSGPVFLMFMPWLGLATGLSYWGLRRENLRRYA